MIRNTSTAHNPFAMLLDPARIAFAVAHSERLNRLQRRVYRPLDKPVVSRDAADFDLLDAAAPDETAAGDGQA